jgi:hypothetical protein
VKITRTSPAAFTAEFESEDELREEHRVNLSQGGLRLPTAETAAMHATLLMTLRGPWGGEAYAKATVVALLPGGIALAVDGNPEEQLTRLLAKPAEAVPEPVPDEPEPAEPIESDEKRQSVWDRMRGLTQMEKLLLAVKADRMERALLVQDNDPRVLLSLLRNPRLTVEEVVRIAKSSYLTFQIADVIMKAGQWMGSPDVRLALVHNPKTPPPFALRILPLLPDSDVRAIARAGTSMALKTAALRRLQGK